MVKWQRTESGVGTSMVQHDKPRASMTSDHTEEPAPRCRRGPVVSSMKQHIASAGRVTHSSGRIVSKMASPSLGTTAELFPSKFPRQLWPFFYVLRCTSQPSFLTHVNRSKSVSYRIECPELRSCWPLIDSEFPSRHERWVSLSLARRGVLPRNQEQSL